MNSSILSNYIEKIYGYAINKTYTREEADELAQEILLTVIKELPKLKNENSFEPWLWGVANNTTKTFRRYMGKQRAMYSYDTLEDLSFYDEYELINDDVYEKLREKIAMLSNIYRDIIILYYYDDLPVKKIAEMLDIPEGTVTWRLSEGRRKLKKEYMNMNETVLRPAKLEISINGDGNYNGTTSPFPNVYIQDALSQNILYHCYLNPKTIEELARLCGVPAYYIEDSILNLIYREAMTESSKGKYRTEFIIYDDGVNSYTDRVNYIFEPIIEEFVASLKTLTQETSKLGIYTAGKTDDDLIYLFGLLALEHLSKKHNPVIFVERPVRYDGYRWSYHGHLQDGKKYFRRGLGREASMNLGGDGKYSHYSYHFSGFAYRKMMFDNEINICEDILKGYEIIDTVSAASAIANGYVKKKEDGTLFVTIPSFTKKQKESFDKLVDDIFAVSIIDYSAAVSRYVKGYKKLFPTHLSDDVMRACNYMFITLFATTLCQIAREEDMLILPSPESICDVLIQSKE